MELKEKNSIFIQNGNRKDQVLVFHDKLKRYLSGQYLYLTDQKDDLESQILQLKVEKEQKDKTLFPTLEQKNVRKYFSPLNLKEIDKEQKDEKQKQLMIEIERIQTEISSIDNQIQEIKSFLADMDDILLDDDTLENSENSESEVSFGIEDEDLDRKEKEERFVSVTEIYPQMLRNLYGFSDYLRIQYPSLEVLIEFNDNNIDTSEDVNRNLMEQLENNVIMALQDYDISMILIQGSVTEEQMDVTLSYVCDVEKVDTVSIHYTVSK